MSTSAYSLINEPGRSTRASRAPMRHRPATGARPVLPIAADSLGCRSCTTELAKALKAQLGSIPSGARKGLGLPRLHPIEGRSEEENDRSDEQGHYIPCGDLSASTTADSPTDPPSTGAPAPTVTIRRSSSVAPPTTTMTGAAAAHSTNSSEVDPGFAPAFRPAPTAG